MHQDFFSGGKMQPQPIHGGIKMSRVFQSLTTLAGLLIALIFASPALADASRAQPKEWTFLIFLNGNNNLDSYGEMNMNQMEKIGSTDKVNVVVQWASLKNRGTGRYLITKDSDTKRVNSPRLENLGKSDMGDYRELIEFVRWGVQNYPAKKYFINVWDHGSGWHFTRDGVTKDISWDDNTGHHITTEQLALAIHESAKIIGHKVDLYGSDACLMGMVEIAHEMKDSVSVFLGSEETEPAEGWPYDAFLGNWNRLPDGGTAQDVAKVLIKEYKSYYQVRNENVTLSAFNLDFIGSLNKSLRGFADSLTQLDEKGRELLAEAAKASTHFTNDDYVDLGDFISQVKSKRISARTDATINEIALQTKNFVVDNITLGFPRAQGAAIWIPTDSWTYSRHADRYSRLNFDHETHWGDVAKIIANASK
jgi:hypothetical protein